jgi:hypothetical protein
MKLELEIEVLEFKIAATKKLPMKVDYLSGRREVIIQSLSLDMDDDEVVLSFRHLDLRLSEDAVRKLFESLPPEMLRRL